MIFSFFSFHRSAMKTLSILLLLLTHSVLSKDILVLVDVSWYTGILETWLNLQWINPDGFSKDRLMFIQIGYFQSTVTSLPNRSWVNFNSDIVLQVHLSEKDVPVKSTVVFNQISKNRTLLPDNILVLSSSLLSIDKFPEIIPMDSFFVVQKNSLFNQTAQKIGPARTLFSLPSPTLFDTRDVSISDCSHPLARPYCLNGTISHCVTSTIDNCIGVNCALSNGECINNLPPCWYPTAESCLSQSEKCLWNRDDSRCEILQTPKPTLPRVATWSYDLVKRDVECRSEDENIAKNRVNLYACADACSNTPGCVFFIFGKQGASGTKTGNCFWEKTATRYCTEGFAVDSYDFYELDFNIREELIQTSITSVVMVIVCAVVCVIAYYIQGYFRVFPLRNYIDGLHVSLINFRLSGEYVLEGRSGNRLIGTYKGVDYVFKQANEQDAERKELFNEMEMLQRFKNESVVEFYGWMRHSGPVWTMLTVNYGPTLHEYLTLSPNRSEEIKEQVICELLSIATFVHETLHQQCMAHMNLTSESVIVGSDRTERIKLRLGGFQCCTKTLLHPRRTRADNIRRKNLNIKWCCLDTLNEGPSVPGNTYNDIWSFGCLLCEVWTGKAPFRHVSVDDGGEFQDIHSKLTNIVCYCFFMFLQRGMATMSRQEVLPP